MTATTQTVDTAAATPVETTAVDTDQTQRDMRDVAAAMFQAGELGNDALDFLAKVFDAPKAEDAQTIINNANRATISVAAGVACMMVQLKRDPNGVIAKSLPDLVKRTYLAQIDKVDRSVILDVARTLSKLCNRYNDEDLASYGDAGCFYAGTPLGVDFGLEVGTRTGDGADTQRSGLVIGLRLDHLTGAKPASRLGLPKMKG